MFKKFISFVLVLTLATVVISLMKPVPANAAASTRISFTFDDALLSTYSQAAPTLATYGYRGTVYVTTGCVGSVGTCPADEDAIYMSWAQLGALQATYGWEVGAHTVTHPLMTEISDAQKITELSQSKQDLIDHGFNPVSFASPYGDYNPTVQSLALQYYTSHRGFWDIGYNTAPYDKSVLRVQQVQVGVSVATVKGYIDQANANGTWLILVFHDIKTSPSSNPDDYNYATSDLNQIAAYVKSLNLAVTTVGDAVGAPAPPAPTPQTDLMTNGNFDAGVTLGWTTDSPTNVKADTTNKGNGVSPKTSVAITTSTTKNVHLFSPKIAVTQQTYLLSLYLRLAKLTSQELGFYIDEYDAAGNWISGQYKGSKYAKFTGLVRLSYVPSSNNVKFASLQIYVIQKSGITAYIDNVQWLGAAVTPAPTPTPTPVPTDTNLLTNAGFDSGLGTWTTDSPANITADGAGNGSGTNPATSVKLTSKTSGNAHLFSPKVAVDSTKTYTLSTYLIVITLTTGEVGFYVDEYDVNGNWISGKWVTAVYAVGSQTVSFTYTPSSANVKFASLQVYVSGTGITAYLDDAKWLVN